MKIRFSLPEVVEIFKQIQERPEKVFQTIQVDVGKTVEKYLPQRMRRADGIFLQAALRTASG
jgi:hypothetical protein